MALAHSPSIVTSGLRCLIDISNSKCLNSISNTAVDVTGNGFNGILRNQTGTQTSLGSMNTNLTYDTTDTPPACLNFLGLGDATQGYLEFSSHPLGGYSTYSVESWFKITSTTPSADYNVIFYSSAPDNGTQELGLIAQNTIADADVAIEINNAYTGGSSDVRASLGWHHFVLTFNGSTSNLYIDSELAYSRADTNEALPTTGWNWIGVGQWANSGYNGTQGYTQGKLGTLGFYTKALDASEVKRNFNALRGRFNI